MACTYDSKSFNSNVLYILRSRSLEAEDVYEIQPPARSFCTALGTGNQALLHRVGL